MLKNVERMKLSLLPRSQLESRLGIKLRHRNLLVIFHPETNNIQKTLADLNKLLNVLESQSEVGCLFVLPNAVLTYFQAFMTSINEFVASGYNRWVFTSLEPLVYFSVLNIVDAIVGNSSSGLLEAPSFDTATINIGGRQKVGFDVRVSLIFPPRKMKFFRLWRRLNLRPSANLSNPFKTHTLNRIQREELQRIYVISTLESNRSLFMMDRFI